MRFVMSYCKLSYTPGSVNDRQLEVVFIPLCSRAVIGVGVEEEDRKHTWLDDSESVSEHVIVAS